MLRNVLMLMLICALIVACGGESNGVPIVYRDCIGWINDGIVCTHCTLDDVGDPPPGCTYEEQQR